MSAFDLQEKLSRELLSKQPGTYVIHKVTRAGATTTTVKTALDMHLKVILIVPTKKIGEELVKTITQVSGKPPYAFLIRSNPEMCSKIESNGMLFQFKASCKKCPNRDPDKCEFQNLIEGTFDLIILTYHKLSAVFANSETFAAKNILTKICMADVIIFDEFSAATLPNIHTIPVVVKDKLGNVTLLRKKLCPLLQKGEPWQIALMSFLLRFEETKRSDVYTNDVLKLYCQTEASEKQLFSKGWNDITNLTAEPKLKLEMQHAFLAMFSQRVVITVKNGNVGLTPTVQDALWHIKKLVSLLGSEKRIFVIDAYEPSVNFSSIFGKVEPTLWGPNGDPLNTNDKQLIIADSFHWGKKDFFKGTAIQEKYTAIFKKIIEFGADRVLIVTLSQDMAKAVASWGLPKETKITWYRSGLMRGVQAKGCDIMGLLNGPYIPRSAYAASAKSLRLEDYATEMDGLESDYEKEVRLPGLLWLDNLRGEFTNAIGRVKDPNGLQRSVVFAFGMKISEVRSLLKDNSPSKLAKPHIVKTHSNGALLDEGVLIAKLWQNGVAASETELPFIARIISETQQKKSVPASYIITGQTKKVKAVALKYEDLLAKYNVFVVRKTGGVEFRLADH